MSCRESMQSLAQDGGYLMITWANHHYVDFVRTWVWHVRHVGVSGFIVGAMDEAILKELVADGINTFSMNSGLVTSDFGWGSPQFAKMGRFKIKLIGMFLELGVQVRQGCCLAKAFGVLALGGCVTRDCGTTRLWVMAAALQRVGGWIA